MSTALPRRLLSVVALIAGFLVVPFAPAAHADNGCPGTRDAWRNWKNSAGTVAAATELYFTADGGCVSLVSKGAYSGRSKTMLLTVCNMEKTNCVTDSGIYQYYAGPIYRPSINYEPTCYWVHAKMGDGYGNVLFDRWEWFGSCD